MRVISHRGAKGYADENSLAGIKIAAELDIDYIEFDIQYTKNSVIVLQHDTLTPRGRAIKDFTYKTLQREISYMPTLRDALREADGKPVVIESKAQGTIAKALDIIRSYPLSAIASFLPDEILSARINLPNHDTYFLKSNPPFGLVKTALKIDAAGVGMNVKWLPFIPYYYYQARKNSLKMYVYTVDNAILAGILNKLMPKLYIVTNYPKKLVNKDDR